MYWIIDACDYCGQFKRVTLDNVDSENGYSLICEECHEVLGSPSEDMEDEKPVSFKKFTWEYVI